MKKIYAHVKGEVKEGKIDDLNSNNLVWLDYLNPSKNELKELSETSGISLAELREVVDEEEKK